MDTDKLLKKIVDGGVKDIRELDHIYRVLSKRFHPDLSGGDGSSFIRLKEIYERSRADIRARTIAERTASRTAPQQEGGDRNGSGGGPGSAGSSFGSSSAAGAHADGKSFTFDPYFIVTESGFPRSLHPRGCLYLSLRRFYSLGMHNYRIRSMQGLKKRNALVLRSIFHWSYIYDPTFPPIFAAYTRHHLQFLSTTWEVKNYNFARRLFSDGISGFFNYQHSGRKGTAEVAAEKFRLSAGVLKRCVGEDHPLVPLSQWYGRELEHPPVFTEYE